MPLLRILLLVFPLIELASLIMLGQAVGVGWTLLWVLFTGVAGLMLIQRNGWGMLQRLQQQMLANRSPQAILKSGMWGVLAGALIAFPGVVSDVLAVPCLIMALLHRGGNGPGSGDDNQGGPRTYRYDEHIIIEGEWESEEPACSNDTSRLNRP
ncbi:MAG: FxsA family protein [Pseudomonas sp.]